MIEITDENFEKIIKDSEKPVLVDFFTSWCAPCSILAPILEKLAEDLKEKFILIKVNLDNVPLTAQKIGIEKIPTVIIFREGKPVSGFVGLRPEQSIREWLEKILKEDKTSLTSREEIIKKIIEEYKDYAGQKGFKLNPNKEIVEGIIKGLLANEKKHGKRYCPCRRVTGNPAVDQKNICPCSYHLEEIEKNGYCLCRLFQK